MTRTLTTRSPASLRSAGFIDRLAALFAPARQAPRGTRIRPDQLTDHLRRDLGLPSSYQPKKPPF